MASEKISEMTAASDVFAADLIPIVQGGANFNCTREELLQAGSGEDIAMVADILQSAYLFDAAFTTFVEVHDDAIDIRAIYYIHNVVSSASSLSYMDVHQGGIALAIGADCFFNLTTFPFGPGAVRIDGSTQIFSVTGFASADIQCDVANSAYWSGDPVTLSEAIDRIAAVVSAGGATPIP